MRKRKWKELWRYARSCQLNDDSCCEHTEGDFGIAHQCYEDRSQAEDDFDGCGKTPSGINRDLIYRTGNVIKAKLRSTFQFYKAKNTEELISLFPGWKVWRTTYFEGLAITKDSGAIRIIQANAYSDGALYINHQFPGLPLMDYNIRKIFEEEERKQIW